MATDNAKTIFRAAAGISIALAVIAVLSWLVIGPPGGTLFAMIALTLSVLNFITGLAFIRFLRAKPALAAALTRPAPELPVRQPAATQPAAPAGSESETAPADDAAPAPAATGAADHKPSA